MSQICASDGQIFWASASATILPMSIQGSGRGLIFWYHIFFPFHTAHGVLQARVLEWVAISSSRRPHLARTLHYDPFILGSHAQQDSQLHWVMQAPSPQGCDPWKGLKLCRYQKQKRISWFELLEKVHRERRHLYWPWEGISASLGTILAKQWIWTLKHKLCKGMTFGYNPI